MSLSGVFLKGYLHRLPFPTPPPPVWIPLILGVGTSIGVGAVLLWGQRLQAIAPFLPPDRSVTLILTGVLMLIFLFASLLLPTVAPSEGRAALLCGLPVPHRRLALAAMSPVTQAWGFLTLLLLPIATKLLAALDVPVVGAALTVLALSVLAFAAAQATTAVAVWLARSRVLWGWSSSTLTALLALTTAVAVLMATRRMQSTSGHPAPLDSLLAGKNGPAELLGISAVILTLLGLSFVLAYCALPSLLIPRTSWGAGHRGASVLRFLGHWPAAVIYVRLLRLPRLREFAQLSTAVVISLILLTSTTSPLLRAASMENLMFLVGVCSVVEAGLFGALVTTSGTIVERNHGVRSWQLWGTAVVTCLVHCALRAGLLGGTILLILDSGEVGWKHLGLLLLCVPPASLACLLLGGRILPTSKVRTSADGVMIFVAGGMLGGCIWAISKTGFTAGPVWGQTYFLASIITSIVVLAVVGVLHIRGDRLKKSPRVGTASRPFESTRGART